MQIIFWTLAITFALFSVNGEVFLSEVALVENATDAISCYNSVGEMLVGQIKLLSGLWSLEVAVTSGEGTLIAQGSRSLDREYNAECAGVIKSNLQRQWLICLRPVHGDLTFLSWENNVWTQLATPEFSTKILLCDVFSDPSPADGFVVLVQDRDNQLMLLRPNTVGNTLLTVTAFNEAEFPETAFVWGSTHQYYHQQARALAISFNFVYSDQNVIEPRELLGKLSLPISASSGPTNRNFSGLSAVVGSTSMSLFYGNGCNVTVNLPGPYANLGIKQQMIQTKSDTFLIPVLTKHSGNQTTGVLYLVQIIEQQLDGNNNACGGQEDLEVIEAFHLPVYSSDLIITSSTVALDKTSFTWVITAFNKQSGLSTFVRFSSFVDSEYLPSFLELDDGIIDDGLTYAPTSSPTLSNGNNIPVWERKEVFILSSTMLGIILLGMLNGVYNIFLFGDTMQLYIVEHMF